MRVPIGSRLELISTHALSSKRIVRPSRRCCGAFVLTTMARRMSPGFTLSWLRCAPWTRAFCTTTVISSPAPVSECHAGKNACPTYRGPATSLQHLDAFHHLSPLPLVRGGPGAIPSCRRILSCS